MKKFFTVLWLIIFSMSCVIASDENDKMLVIWRCIYCQDVCYSSDSKYPNNSELDQPICEGGKSLHIWSIKSVKTFTKEQIKQNKTPKPTLKLS